MEGEFADVEVVRRGIRSLTWVGGYLQPSSVAGQLGLSQAILGPEEVEELHSIPLRGLLSIGHLRRDYAREYDVEIAEWQERVLRVPCHPSLISVESYPSWLQAHFSDLVSFLLPTLVDLGGVLG